MNVATEMIEGIEKNGDAMTEVDTEKDTMKIDTRNSVYDMLTWGINITCLNIPTPFITVKLYKAKI